MSCDTLNFIFLKPKIIIILSSDNNTSNLVNLKVKTENSQAVCNLKLGSPMLP
jgi:hypothetical protein